MGSLLIILVNPIAPKVGSSFFLVSFGISDFSFKPPEVKHDVSPAVSEFVTVTSEHDGLDISSSLHALQVFTITNKSLYHNLYSLVEDLPVLNCGLLANLQLSCLSLFLSSPLLHVNGHICHKVAGGLLIVH